MAQDSRQLALTLAQVLENFQRCGVARFGSRLACELPPEWLIQLAELSPVGGTAAVAAAAVGAPPNPATSPAAGQPAGPAPPRPHSVSPSSPPRVVPSGNPAPAISPAGGASLATLAPGGLSAAPWNLPVLDNVERQQRFERLNAEVRDCRRCAAIVGYRQQTVFGDGPLQPTVCFMGEAPGADEDRSGVPFVGKAGQLLMKIIAAMKLSREEVYILNALKCRPPQNRTPVSDEIDNCRGYVEQQLDTLQPRFIVCLGAVAVRSLLQSDLSIGRLRGQFHQYRGARVVVTYHPSYLLRNESAKRLVWEDMKMLMAELPTA